MHPIKSDFNTRVIPDVPLSSANRADLLLSGRFPYWTGQRVIYGPDDEEEEMGPGFMDDVCVRIGSQS